ncbi:MAG: hypothetical protein DRQ55_16795 [Planctomycetota bacterium]|nr:MAG: hypothetical protein DRQ55_16795 [Planctomycetota bacterium]
MDGGHVLSYVTHLEGAIDGARLPARTLQTLHEGRPILVRYDLDGVRAAVDRDALAARPDGLWRYRELLPLDDGDEVVSLGETTTPLLDCPRLAAHFGVDRLLIKDESRLPTGSFKARGGRLGGAGGGVGGSSEGAQTVPARSEAFAPDADAPLLPVGRARPRDGRRTHPGGHGRPDCLGGAVGHGPDGSRQHLSRPAPGDTSRAHEPERSWAVNRLTQPSRRSRSRKPLRTRRASARPARAESRDFDAISWTGLMPILPDHF